MIFEVTGKLRLNKRSREWCKLPYPRHPIGCPNYGIKETCPPKAPLIQDFIDLGRPHWFVVVRFSLEGHVAKMRREHPAWSEAQLRNLLYWQSRLNSRLHGEVGNFAEGDVYTLCPEAMGINILITALDLGIPMELKPVHYVHKVALVGFRNSFQYPEGPY